MFEMFENYTWTSNSTNGEGINGYIMKALVLQKAVMELFVTSSKQCTWGGRCCQVRLQQAGLWRSPAPRKGSGSITSKQKFKKQGERRACLLFSLSFLVSSRAKLVYKVFLEEHFTVHLACVDHPEKDMKIWSSFNSFNLEWKWITRMR